MLAVTLRVILYAVLYILNSSWSIFVDARKPNKFQPLNLNHFATQLTFCTCNFHFLMTFWEFSSECFAGCIPVPRDVAYSVNCNSVAYTEYTDKPVMCNFNLNLFPICNFLFTGAACSKLRALYADALSCKRELARDRAYSSPYHILSVRIKLPVYSCYAQRTLHAVSASYMTGFRLEHSYWLPVCSLSI